MQKTAVSFSEQSEDSTNHLIEYYEAFEYLLTDARKLGEYRTHFGILDEVSSDYCFFKAISKPFEYESSRREAQLAMDKLHKTIFNDGPQTSPVSILDIGFGCGGTIEQLSTDYPESIVHGININPVQFKFALSKLQNNSNIELFLGDFLQENTVIPTTYDLIYFIESAFHIPDKDALCRKTASILQKGGYIYIIDIFYSEILANRHSKYTDTQEAIFDYMTIQKWSDHFKKYDVEFDSYIDISKQVSNHLQITTSAKEFENEYISNIFIPLEDTEIVKSRLMEAYIGYEKLHRLLKKNLLHYGILRFKKA
jgi:ubiquinone/menaquinone biosynthesis C-methylase UbiE